MLLVLFLMELCLDYLFQINFRETWTWGLISSFFMSHSWDYWVQLPDRHPLRLHHQTSGHLFPEPGGDLVFL